MSQILVKQGRGLLALLAVLALAAAACSSSSGTQAPGGSATPGSEASASGEATTMPSSGGNGGLVIDDNAFANINSYQFKMVILSEEITGSLAALTGGSADAAMTISGTVISKPEQAASLNIGTFNIIEVGGKQYIDLGSGTYISSPMDPGDTSMAESFSPGVMFGSFISAADAEGFANVGTESKNGVQAAHFQASSAALAMIGSQAGIEGATWTCDVWVAQDGGYPVSFALIGTKDAAVVYQISFDVTNVNDPSNKVEAPKTSL
jgi:hypothetical protein